MSRLFFLSFVITFFASNISYASPLSVHSKIAARQAEEVASAPRSLVSSARATTVCPTNSKAAFAHFLVGNVPTWNISDWENDFRLAQDAHIDAFSLNIVAGDSRTATSLSYAFTAANSVGFKLFFSFDYTGTAGAWLEADIISLITAYGPNGAYYQYNGKPLISTFEGAAYASDWTAIKAATNCFLVPDWSSLTPEAAVATDVIDGLLSWSPWPWGDLDMDTHTDAAFMQYLGTLPYMMPVSPWFYANLPDYDKNWIWRGDDLWYDRWEEVMFVQPEFVQILSWNDFGESHYIGPLDDNQYGAFDVGGAPYNYALDMPHDGWRLFLPYVIDLYKSGTASVTEEGLVAWYRLSPGTACPTGGTSGNTALHYQLEFEPYEVAEDKIFFSALLGSSTTVTVTVGGEDLGAAWSSTPAGGVGIYHGNVSFTGKTGAVEVKISRSGNIVASINGPSITDSCTGDIENWNAWVGQSTGSTIAAVSPSLAVCDQVCTAGKGTGNFEGLCSFTCALGYCPIGACTCTAMGPQATLPTATGVQGYPIAGEGSAYIGLCSFACNYGFCPPAACGTVDVGTTEPVSSPFDPPACTAGSGVGNLGGLCSFSCSYGVCPINACTCTATGVLVTAPAVTADAGYVVTGLDETLYSVLCNFACTHGYCPEAACTTTKPN
ncbi:hypothetical protein BP5796_01246 [Coleophoma crateriformis]|uniref:Glycoside hydrolase family 71 protein n=1 Tax=Coleophoma crateriformis TaxID=565419 RepID=A0A3D8SZW6_9HELO|nr:hypothetical protein BP5796_01246 [Coleophoma crateriformis]